MSSPVELICHSPPPLSVLPFPSISHSYKTTFTLIRLALVSFPLSEMRDWFFDPFFGWGRTLNLPECLCLAADWAHVSGCVKWARMAFVSPLWNPYLILLKGEQRQHTHTLSPFPIAAISCFYQQLTQRTFDTTTILQTKQVTIHTTNTQYFPHRSRVAVQRLALHLNIYTLSGHINIYAFTQFRKCVYLFHLCYQLESDNVKINSSYIILDLKHMKSATQRVCELFWEAIDSLNQCFESVHWNKPFEQKLAYHV